VNGFGEKTENACPVLRTKIERVRFKKSISRIFEIKGGTSSENYARNYRRQGAHEGTQQDETERGDVLSLKKKKQTTEERESNRHHFVKRRKNPMRRVEKKPRLQKKSRTKEPREMSKKEKKMEEIHESSYRALHAWTTKRSTSHTGRGERKKTTGRSRHTPWIGPASCVVPSVT